MSKCVQKDSQLSFQVVSFLSLFHFFRFDGLLGPQAHPRATQMTQNVAPGPPKSTPGGKNAPFRTQNPFKSPINSSYENCSHFWDLGGHKSQKITFFNFIYTIEDTRSEYHIQNISYTKYTKNTKIPFYKNNLGFFLLKYPFFVFKQNTSNVYFVFCISSIIHVW